MNTRTFAKMLPNCGPDQSYYESNGSCKTTTGTQAPVYQQPSGIDPIMFWVFGAAGVLIIGAVIVSLYIIKKGKK